MLTPDFSGSQWCDQEVGFALAQRKLVVPLKFGADPHGFIGKYPTSPRLSGLLAWTRSAGRRGQRAWASLRLDWIAAAVLARVVERSGTIIANRAGRLDVAYGSRHRTSLSTRSPRRRGRPPSR
jgi:hypothetical protein